MTLDTYTLGWLSILFTVVSVAPYYYFILKGTIKPHAFSWFIWGVLTAIGFSAQYSAGAGPGAWSTGAGCVACLTITALALFKGEREITRSDVISLIAALSAIPLWVVTQDPLWSVILISAIDLMGYYPTVRKSYRRPHEELIFTHLTGALKFMLGMAALESWTMTTWLYPACIAGANLLLVTMIYIRRREVERVAVEPVGSHLLPPSKL